MELRRNLNLTLDTWCDFLRLADGMEIGQRVSESDFRRAFRPCDALRASQGESSSAGASVGLADSPKRGPTASRTTEIISRVPALIRES